jgi:hypothetical protein
MSYREVHIPAASVMELAGQESRLAGQAEDVEQGRVHSSSYQCAQYFLHLLPLSIVFP